MLPATFTPPLLRQLELLRLRSRRNFLGSRQGGHLSPKRGHGIEFSDFRQYELGDDLRHIDWGVYARSDKLYIKRFQEEQDLSVLIILDTTASMNTPAADRKWSRAVELALGLSYVGLMQQDRVLLSAPGHLISPAYYGGRAFHTLSDSLAKIEIGKEIDLSHGVQQALSQVRFPGVAIFISDFLFPFNEVQKIFYRLRAKNLDLYALQILGQSDLSPLTEYDSALAVDSETGEQVELLLNQQTREDYQKLLLAHFERLEVFFVESNISFTSTSAASDLSRFFSENLTKLGLVG